MLRRKFHHLRQPTPELWNKCLQLSRQNIKFSMGGFVYYMKCVVKKTLHFIAGTPIRMFAKLSVLPSVITCLILLPSSTLKVRRIITMHFPFVSRHRVRVGLDGIRGSTCPGGLRPRVRFAVIGGYFTSCGMILFTRLAKGGDWSGNASSHRVATWLFTLAR